MSLRDQIRRYWAPFAAILVLVVLAAGVGLYVLRHQRVTFPWEDRYTVKAEFTSAQAVTPGQGQNVEVAGVTVGEISKVELVDGRAVVTMTMDPGKLKAVHADARMLLRPKTGLNDMSVELSPGSDGARRLGDGETLPVASTEPNVNPDEVLASLDADTRAYLSIVANAGGTGLQGRGRDLRAVLIASKPALEQTRRITASLADRRAKLARLVHNLRELSVATAAKDSQLGRLVDQANATFGALGSQEGALSQSFARLPGTLAQARGALVETQGLAERLGPALVKLRPVARRLPGTLAQLNPLLRESEPILRTQIRPLVRSARPLVRDLPPTLRDLNRVTPTLSRAFRVLNYVVNELAFNPPGSEEGYLFWLAWFNHNANSILSLEDGHGVAWRGQVITSCSTLATLPAASPLLQLIVAPNPACP